MLYSDFCGCLYFLLVAAGSVSEINKGGFLGTGICFHIKTSNNDLIRNFTSENFSAVLLLQLLYRLKEEVLGSNKLHLFHIYFFFIIHFSYTSDQKRRS